MIELRKNKANVFPEVYFILSAFLFLFSPFSASAVVVDLTQMGTTTMAATVATSTIAITPVDPTKSILFFSNNPLAVAGNDPRYASVRGQIINGGTDIQFERATFTTSATNDISWSLASFESGVSVQRGTVSLTTTGTTSVAISAVDLTKSFVLVSSSASTVDTGYSSENMYKVRITSPTTLDFYVAAGTPSETVDWQVVEITDGATVKYGEFISGLATVTVSTSSTPGRSVLFLTNSGTVGNETALLVSGTITDSSTLSFVRNTANGNINVVWYLVEFTDGTRVHNSPATSMSTVNNIQTISPVKLNRSIITKSGSGVFGNTVSNANNIEQGACTVTLTSNSSVRTLRVSGTASTFSWSVVEFPLTTVKLKPGVRLKGGVRLRPLFL